MDEKYYTPKRHKLLNNALIFACLWTMTGHPEFLMHFQLSLRSMQRIKDGNKRNIEEVLREHPNQDLAWNCYDAKDWLELVYCGSDLITAIERAFVGDETWIDVQIPLPMPSFEDKVDFARRFPALPIYFSVVNTD